MQLAPEAQAHGRARQRGRRRTAAARGTTQELAETEAQARRRASGERTVLARMTKQRASGDGEAQPVLASSDSAAHYARSTEAASRARGEREGALVAPVGQASDFVRGLAFLVPAFPDRTRRQLLRQLSQAIAAPSSAELRDARLGLLVAMLRRSGAVLVSTEEYMAERARRRKRGEHWPSATALSRAFGEWRTAQLAALHLGFAEGPKRRQARSRTHTGPRRKYTEAEAIQALIDVREALGVWLLGTEYAELVALCRRAARSAGLPEPRLPGDTPIRRLFSNYRTFLAAARSAYGEPEDPALRVLIDIEDHQRFERDNHPDTGGPLDELAARTWQLLQGLRAADKRIVYFSLTRSLRRVRTLRAEVCMRALSACQTDCQRTYISRRCYDDWRGAQPDSEPWPPSSWIRRTYNGSWPAALDDLGADPTPDILLRRKSGHLGKFSPEELIAGVQAWAQTVPLGTRLRFIDYKRWAYAQLAAPDCPWARLCVHATTFNDRIGAWAKVLDDAGYGHRAADYVPHGRFYDKHELLVFLRAAAVTNPGRKLSPALYDAWAAEERARVAERGELPYVADYDTHREHFGTWAAALLAAGVITRREYDQRLRTRGVRMSEEELVAVLRWAIGELGPKPGKTDYRRWRDDVLDSENPPIGGLPSDSWLAQQLGHGSWTEALSRVA